MRLRFFLISIVGIFAIFLPISGLIHAQSTSDVLVNVVPTNPAPFEEVAITLNSYAYNLDSVSISWYVSGKNMLSGIGEKSFRVNAPASGSETTVTARIASPDGTVEQKIVIRPATLTLLWESTDSHVPPFYRGKSLPAPDSGIRVVAMPRIKSGGSYVDAKKMIYSWKKDYTNVQEGSGYGKDSFSYVGDYLDKSNNIGVTVSTLDGLNSAESTIDIFTTKPKILFYREDGKVGTLWEQVLQSPHRISGEEIVVAEPYFVSPENIQNPRLVFSWLINGSPVNILDFRKNIMPVKVPEGISGTSKLQLNIEHKDKVFQSVSKTIDVIF